MDEKDRIELVIKKENLTAALFAAEIGIQSSTLSHIINGRNKPSLDVLKKILIRYPFISSDWLILGQGPYERSTKHSQAPSLFDFEEEIDSKSTLSTEKMADKSVSSSVGIQNKKVVEPEISALPVSESVQSMIPLVETPSKSVRKIIVYYTDNTFQEFEAR
jgi:transcriptional regulator with XRE-family HTH domain